jgi:hypothetical protein
MGFDYKKWLNPQALDLWSEWVASCSLFDIDPESKSFDALASDPTSIRVMLDVEGNAGIIKYYIHNDVRHYRRKDFIEWALSKRLPVRDEMLNFVKGLEPDAVEDLHSVNTNCHQNIKADADEWPDYVQSQSQVKAESVEASNKKRAGRDNKKTKLEKQQTAILEVIKLKDFTPLAIPDGGKVTLKMICEADYPELFDGSSSFDNAWKSSKDLFRMANYASYSKRGKG